MENYFYSSPGEINNTGHDSLTEVTDDIDQVTVTRVTADTPAGYRYVHVALGEQAGRSLVQSLESDPDMTIVAISEYEEEIPLPESCILL